MTTVALQQVSSFFAQENAKRTLEKPIRIEFIRKFIEPALYTHLEALCTNGLVYVWGSKSERIHQTYKVLGRDALFLFRRGSTVYRYGVAIEKTTDEVLAESLWGVDRDGEVWSTIYFFARITDKVLPAAQINKHLKRSPKDNWQGLVVLTMKESDTVNAFFKSQLEEIS